MLTLTPPGADLLPWDEQVCAHLGPHKHTGELGCRIKRRYADNLNESAPERARQLNRVAKQRADRELRRRGINERRGKLVHAWEHQRRDAVHQHLAAPARLPARRHRLLGAAARHDAGREQRQCRRLTAWQRQAVDLFAAHHHVHVGFRRLDERRRLAHGDGFRDASDLERRVDGELLADLESQPVAFERLEAGELDRELVGARRHIGEHVRAGSVRRRRTDEPGVRVAERDAGARQHGMMRIADDALQRGRRGLAGRRGNRPRGGEHEEQRDRTAERSATSHEPSAMRTARRRRARRGCVTNVTIRQTRRIILAARGLSMIYGRRN